MSLPFIYDCPARCRALGGSRHQCVCGLAVGEAQRGLLWLRVISALAEGRRSKAAVETGFKQHTSVISPSQRAEAWVGSASFSPRPSTRWTSVCWLYGAPEKRHLAAHSGGWQRLVPRGCRTEALVSLLGVPSAP